ncbi:unnamed protein product, partial [Closterium sp. NIES-54]
KRCRAMVTGNISLSGGDDVQTECLFEVPLKLAIRLELPELDGKAAKMYRGGKICLTIHFKPLWAKNSPRFGIAHALCLGLGPWLAAEVPFLVDSGVVRPKDATTIKPPPTA